MGKRRMVRFFEFRDDDPRFQEIRKQMNVALAHDDVSKMQVARHDLAALTVKLWAEFNDITGNSPNVQKV